MAGAGVRRFGHPRGLVETVETLNRSHAPPSSPPDCASGAGGRGEKRDPDSASAAARLVQRKRENWASPLATHTDRSTSHTHTEEEEEEEDDDDDDDEEEEEEGFFLL